MNELILFDKALSETFYIAEQTAVTTVPLAITSVFLIFSMKKMIRKSLEEYMATITQQWFLLFSSSLAKLSVRVFISNIRFLVHTYI